MASESSTPMAPLTQRPGDLIVQAPEGAAEGLLLLFHGVGSSAEDLAPWARCWRATCPGIGS